MNLQTKLILCFMIVTYRNDSCLTRPAPNQTLHYKSKDVLDSSETRNEHQNKLRRQVVQPKWLTNADDSIVIDPNVHVNEENLREAAEIRKSIQDAVKSGRFVVGEDPSMAGELSPMSFFNWEMFKFPNNMPTFAPFWPTMRPMQAPPAIEPVAPATVSPTVSPTEQPNFWENMQRFWSEFMDNSRQWFDFNLN